MGNVGLTAFALLSMVCLGGEVDRMVNFMTADLRYRDRGLLSGRLVW